MALPIAHQGPFQYTTEELTVLLAWTKEEILTKFEESPVPVAVLAMKLLS
jgi:hypothetical protein